MMEYNKDWFLRQFRRVVEPLISFYTKNCAGLNIGCTGAAYEDRTISMEGFCRILWGLAPLWAGGEDIDGFQAVYNRGFAEGTNPQASEYWGDMHDCDQKFVELAAVAYALIMAPDKLWKPLNEQVKIQLASYLYRINDYELSDNNWQLFVMLINLALKRLNRKYSQQKVEYALSRLDAFYLGNGWYKDGTAEQRDYYVSFALHFYSLIYCIVCYDEDRERCEKYKHRAAEFAKDFIYWFDDKGRALPYGRSLTYRFAQTAFWSACVVADVNAFSISLVKGIVVRHLKEWLSNPIFDNSGILTIGYRYPNLHMSESYNAPGSPYWSLKAFIILALPYNHPFWNVDIEEFPALDKQKLLPEAGMVIQHNGSNMTALIGGCLNYVPHNHIAEKYCKFAYSSEFAFSVPRSNRFFEQAAPDSMLSFEIDGYIFTRGLCHKVEISKDKILTEWSPFEGINVITEIIPTGKGHIRKHIIMSEYECIARDAGFSIYDKTAECEIRGNMVTVRNSFSFCSVTAGVNGMAEKVRFHPNTSLAYQKTITPFAKYGINKGKTEIETIIEYF